MMKETEMENKSEKHKETLKNGQVRYKPIKPCKIDNRFWITSDPHNWILVDTATIKPRHHYFPNIKLLSNCIVEFEAKELLGKDWVYLGGINALALSYDALIHKISGQLEEYIKELITTGED